MTIEEVKERVGKIAAIADDDYEVAHCWEDELYQEVLASIAMGRHDADDLASAALETKKIDFARHCA